MKRVLVVLVAAAAASAPALAFDRDDWLQPAPNPSWNEFGVRGHATVQLSPHLYTFRCDGTRNIFLVGDDGVIATDPISVKCARHYRDAIRQVTDHPVKYLVYSHQHWDHVLGGEIFQSDGAVVVAHEACTAHFERRPHPDLALPDMTFRDDKTLTVGNQSLELTYLGRNHGDCLIVMRPDAEHLFVVDLATPGGAPLGQLPDYDLNGYVASLRAIEALDFKAVIGGHGVPVAHPTAISERRQYLEALMAAVKRELDDGANPYALVGRVQVPEFSYLRNYQRSLPGNVERVAMHYLMGW